MMSEYTDESTSVKSSTTGGRGLFANQNFGPGELLFSSPYPLLAVLDTSRLHDTCSYCFHWTVQQGSRSSLVVSAPKACSGCKVVEFCNKTCQSRAWKSYHKYECSKLDAIPKGRLPVPNIVRALVRILLMRAGSAISRNDWTELTNLEAHQEKVKKQEDPEQFAAHISLVQRYADPQSHFGQELVERLYAILSVNAFTLVTPEYDPLGACADLRVAAINHSCEPNAFIAMDGPQLSLRSLGPIEKGAEICITYIDPSYSFRQRGQLLAQKYFFVCSCPKCGKGPTLREDLYLRDVNSAPKQILHAIDNDIANEWCAGNEERSKLKDKQKSEVELREFRLACLNYRVVRYQQAARREGKKDGLESCLQICHSLGIFRFDRQPFSSLIHDYMVALISNGDFHHAFQVAIAKYFHIIPYHFPTPHHPLRVVHAWTLAQLALYVAAEREDERTLAWERRGLDFGVVIFGLLKEAEQNVAKSHGAASRFARGVRAKVEEVTTDMTRGDRAAFGAIPGRIMGQMQTLKTIGDDLEMP